MAAEDFVSITLNLNLRDLTVFKDALDLYLYHECLDDDRAFAANMREFLLDRYEELLPFI